MLFHRFCDQNKTQLNGMSSDPSESELVARTMLISHSKIKSMTGHGQPIVHFSFFGKKLLVFLDITIFIEFMQPKMQLNGISSDRSWERRK